MYELLILCFTFLSAIYMISRTISSFYESKAAKARKFAMLARLKARKKKKDDEDSDELSLLEGLMEELGLPPETAIIAKAAMPGLINRFIKTEKPKEETPGLEGSYT